MNNGIGSRFNIVNAGTFRVFVIGSGRKFTLLI
jgi:hypothetical protein